MRSCRVPPSTSYQAGAIDPETDALLRENGVDHGEHSPHLLYDSLQEVLGPTIFLPKQPPQAQHARKGSGAGVVAASAEDEARLRRVGQEWSIPPEEIAKRCVSCGTCRG